MLENMQAGSEQLAPLAESGKDTEKYLIIHYLFTSCSSQYKLFYSHQTRQLQTLLKMLTSYQTPLSPSYRRAADQMSAIIFF
jgi:hypothetical protein